MTQLNIIIIFLLLSSSILCATEKEHKKRHHEAHIHGHGKLNAAIERNKLMIEIEVPAYNIVGFEHQAKTDKQKSKVKQAVDIFRKPQLIIKLDASAGCSLAKKAEVKADLLEKKKEESSGNHNQHRDEAEEHSEFHVEYSFHCKKIDNIKAIHVRAFQQFSGIEELEARAITPKGQFTQELKQSSANFRLEQ
ncbi:MAG: DUF2796 domain-containing protein [Bdellovibrionaceae bacterium]|jgi:hypothetical protein|nr:DUF2796 domain-containing protein [Pseudobdellovibrionaceae bacterium]